MVVEIVHIALSFPSRLINYLFVKAVYCLFEVYWGCQKCEERAHGCVWEGEDGIFFFLPDGVCCANNLLLELGGEVVSTSDVLTIHEDLGDGVLASDGEDGVEADVAVTTGDGNLLVLDALVG